MKWQRETRVKISGRSGRTPIPICLFISLPIYKEAKAEYAVFRETRQ
jgi:hypothetical protein